MTAKSKYSQEVINIAKHYHKWVEWSDEDNYYIGQCPNLFYGGCDGDDEVEVYKELLESVYDSIDISLRNNTLPEPFDYKLDKVKHAT